MNRFRRVSFYKMFGYPTGVGCLLGPQRHAPETAAPLVCGGTVNFATVQGRRHILSPGEAGFEDGTLNYLAFRPSTSACAMLSVGIDDDPDARPQPDAGCSNSCSSCSTATAVRWCASTARPPQPCAAAP